VCLFHVHAPWMSIRVFLSEWIFRHGYYHGFCMDTSTWVCTGTTFGLLEWTSFFFRLAIHESWGNGFHMLNQFWSIGVFLWKVRAHWTKQWTVGIVLKRQGCSNNACYRERIIDTSDTPVACVCSQTYKCYVNRSNYFRGTCTFTYT